MIEAPAKASQVIARARSLSDLPQSKFISHSDELDSLNDSWRDKYQRLIDSADDYYMTTTTLTLSSTNLVAGTQYEFLIALPTDFYKLRFADFYDGSAWIPMEKFPISMKDYNTGRPYYRIQGSSLWVIWGGYNQANAPIKIGYYPPPVTVTCPQSPLEYGTSYTRDLFAGVTAPCYAPAAQTMVYAYGATFIIKAESVTNNTVTAPVALFTESAAVTNIVYYKGTLYWIRGGLIWYKPTGLAAAFTSPTQATTPTGVVAFYIANTNVIYYTTATEIRSCTLTGASDALVNATANVTSVVVIGPTIIYRTTASLVGTLVPSTTMYSSGIAKVTADGGSSARLFILDNAGQTRRVTFNATTAAIVTDEVVDTHAADIGQVSWDLGQTPNTWIVPTLKTENNYQQLLGVDGSVDYTFSYPNNIVPEIMAYQSAIDYRSKREANPAFLMERLGKPSAPPDEPATGLWERFERALRRDEYSAERIRNAYDYGANR